MEQWRQLEDCPGYLVSKDGRVWSEKFNRVLATKNQHGTTVCQFGPKYGKRWQVSIETMVVAYKLGSVDAAIAATKQTNKQKAIAAAKPYNDAKWAATHEKVLAAWEELGSVKLVYERLGCSEHCVHLHLDAAGIYPKQLVEERAAQKRAIKEAERIAREAFRDMKGEQLALFPRACPTCGTPIPLGSSATYCCEECKPSAYKAKKTSELTCCDCGATYYYEKGVSSLTRCENCHAEYEREVRRQDGLYGKTLNARGRYWTRITGADYEPINPEVVFDMDGYVCYLCGCELSKRDGVVRGNYPTVDHVIPLSRGGAHTYDNVRACCHTCNSHKGATMPEEVTCCA